jgi:hypothetical protein
MSISPISGVVDQHVDAPHPLSAGLGGAGVVLANRDVGLQAVCSSLGCHPVDQLLIAARKNNFISGGSSRLHDGSPDSLATSGH